MLRFVYCRGTTMLAVLLISISALSPVSADNHNPLPNLLQTLTGSADNAPFDPALPPPEQAYIVSISQLDEAKLRATWDIDPCCYMYRERFAFGSQTPGITLGEPLFPAGLAYEDEFFGETEIYRGQISIDIPFQQSVSSSQLEVKIDFQGCADIGVCYPPQEQIVPVVLRQLPDTETRPNKVATTMATPVPDIEANRPPEALASKQITANYVSEQDAIANTLIEQRYWALPLFFGFGLLLAFTPCVFPMIPILSGIIMGQQNLTPWRAFRLSAVYVLAMALTYTVAGVIAALLGQNMQIWFQNPWVLTVFSALFVALALAMFGLYPLQMPLRIQNWLNELSNRQRGGRYAGVALMGV